MPEASGGRSSGTFEEDMQIVMVATFFATFASIGGCGLAIFLHRRPSVLVSVVSAFLGSIASWLLYLVAVDGAKIFTSDYWLGDAKLGGLDLLPPLIAISIAISLVPCSVVVAVYQRKWKKHLQKYVRTRPCS